MDTSRANAASNPEHVPPDLLTGQVPPGAARYLTHAIRPGTPLARQAVITFSGQVRLRPGGPWMPFRATETIRAGVSYQVTAHARRGPVRATIEDTYAGGQASSCVRAFGIIPVRTQRGPDLARSARSRLVVESTWLPSAFHPSLGGTWSDHPEGSHLTMPVDGQEIHADFRLGPHGELAELRLCRWSNLTDTGAYDWVAFRARAEAENSFDGYTIPSEIRASWRAGSEQEFDFFHAIVENARFSS
ncbi:DUF6544 family protein [Streptomyces sp. NPDC002851]